MNVLNEFLGRILNVVSNYSTKQRWRRFGKGKKICCIFLNLKTTFQNRIQKTMRKTKQTYQKTNKTLKIEIRTRKRKTF